MMENTINDLISKYREIHSHLMDEYSKGNANNQIMQMYRSRMSSILGFIADLQRLGELNSVRPEVVVPSEKWMDIEFYGLHHSDLYKSGAFSMIHELKRLNPTLTFTELNHNAPTGDKPDEG